MFKFMQGIKQRQRLNPLHGITTFSHAIHARLDHLALTLFIGLNHFQMAHKFIGMKMRIEQTLQRRDGGVA